MKGPFVVFGSSCRTPNQTIYCIGLKKRLFLDDATILDQRDQSRVAGHIFGLWRDPTVDASASMIYSDWTNRTIIKGSEVFMEDLIRPSQIYVHQPYRGPSKYNIFSMTQKKVYTI